MVFREITRFCWFGPYLIIWDLNSMTCSSSSDSKVYIVYMGNNIMEDPSKLLEENEMLLASVHDDSVETARASMVYNYNAFRGFAARMTESQAAALANRHGVVSVFPSQTVQPLTTRSWEFLGFTENNPVWHTSDPSNKAQEDVIIGILDSGIWPESASFSDEGMSPAPSRWKGECQSGDQFPSSTCNKKIIGARHYYSGDKPLDKEEIQSARDIRGHGTHTASIAAGRRVKNMTYQGLAQGNGRGGAPLARLAIYKVCWQHGIGCLDADILAAFDDAMRDGVDIISISLGGVQSEFYMESISIGSFHAVRKGILVIASAGNTGDQGMTTVQNVAPWIITVGAGTIDRNFYANLILTSSQGKNVTIMYETISASKMNASAPVLLGSDARKDDADPIEASICSNGTLDSSKVAGKVILCHQNEKSTDPFSQSSIVEAAGGAGIIIVDDTGAEVSDSFDLPTAYIAKKDTSVLLSFLNSSRNTQAFISEGRTIFGSKVAPQIATFSSRGPNYKSPDILKPDIVAPGVSILASWSPTEEGFSYNIISGTSMACPHVTGIAALIKARNPSWSPSAIHSALVTTAKVTNNRNEPITVQTTGLTANAFDMGAGFLSPESAQSPGLVYETSLQDHINFLCAIGYNSTSIGIITGDKKTTSCPEPLPSVYNINYPSISVSNYSRQALVTRAVKNVGTPQATYKAVLDLPKGFNARVIPNELAFSSMGQVLNFTLQINGKADLSMEFGSLSWVNGQQSVTSPIVLLGLTMA